MSSLSPRPLLIMLLSPHFLIRIILLHIISSYSDLLDLCDHPGLPTDPCRCWRFSPSTGPFHHSSSEPLRSHPLPLPRYTPPNMSTRTFVVLGATGNVGKQAAATLLAAGHHVRVPLRNVGADAAKALKNAGATVIASGFVPGDEKLGGLSIDESILSETFRGSEGAFIFPTWLPTRPQSTRANFFEIVKRAAVASKLPKFVLLSSIGAQVPTGTGNLEALCSMEQLFLSLASPSFQVVSVRAGYFFTNLETSLPNAVNYGVIALSLRQDISLPFLATENIGDEVADQLLS